MSDPKYPKIKVKLVGEDGNAFAIIGRVKKALRRGGISASLVSEFVKEAMSGDYSHVLNTCMDWVTVT